MGNALFLLRLFAVTAGSDKNDNAEKVAEKLEALSVKEGSKESEDETKENAEEKQ